MTIEDNIQHLLDKREEAKMGVAKSALNRSIKKGNLPPESA